MQRAFAGPRAHVAYSVNTLRRNRRHFECPLLKHVRPLRLPSEKIEASIPGIVIYTCCLLIVSLCLEVVRKLASASSLVIEVSTRALTFSLSLSTNVRTSVVALPASWSTAGGNCYSAKSYPVKWTRVSDLANLEFGNPLLYLAFCYDSLRI